MDDYLRLRDARCMIEGDTLPHIKPWFSVRVDAVMNIMIAMNDAKFNNCFLPNSCFIIVLSIHGSIICFYSMFERWSISEDNSMSCDDSVHCEFLDWCAITTLLQSLAVWCIVLDEESKWLCSDEFNLMYLRSYLNRFLYFLFHLVKMVHLMASLRFLSIHI